MKARAVEWWRARSTREQSLLLMCGALAAVMFVYSAVFAPALAWRQDAAERAAARETEFRLVANAARLSSSASDSAGADTPVRNALTQIASQNGIELVFVNARDDGAVDAQIGDAAPDKLFSMIETLERQYGVRVAAADIARVSDGAESVRAQLTFSR